MADELTLTTKFSFIKGAISIVKDISDLALDVAGDEFVHRSQKVGTTEENLDIGDLSSAVPGTIVIWNTDPTNFVSLYRAAGEGAFIRLEAVEAGNAVGHPSMFRLAPGVTIPRVKADTADCKIEFIIGEK